MQGISFLSQRSLDAYDLSALPASASDIPGVANSIFEASVSESEIAPSIAALSEPGPAGTTNPTECSGNHSMGHPNESALPTSSRDIEFAIDECAPARSADNAIVSASRALRAHPTSVQPEHAASSKLNPTAEPFVPFGMRKEGERDEPAQVVNKFQQFSRENAERNDKQRTHHLPQRNHNLAYVHPQIRGNGFVNGATSDDSRNDHDQQHLLSQIETQRTQQLGQLEILQLFRNNSAFPPNVNVDRLPTVQQMRRKRWREKCSFLGCKEEFCSFHHTDRKFLQRWEWFAKWGFLLERQAGFHELYHTFLERNRESNGAWEQRW